MAGNIFYDEEYRRFYMGIIFDDWKKLRKQNINKIRKNGRF